MTETVKPIAWRWRWPFSDDPFLWTYNDELPRTFDPANIIFEPLYAEPIVNECACLNECLSVAKHLPGPPQRGQD